MENPNNKDMKLTVKEAAEILGISEARIRKMLADKVITGKKFGRDWAIPKAQIEAMAKVKRKPGRPKKKPER